MKRLVALAALLLAGSIGKAEAATITFEDLATTPGPRLFSTTVATRFQVDYSSTRPTTLMLATKSGARITAAPSWWSMKYKVSTLITVSQIGAAPFALNSIDISEAHSNGFFSARQVQLTGNVLGGGTVSQLLVLDNNSVNDVFANYFQTFIVDANFGSPLEFHADRNRSISRRSSDCFAIDNVVARPYRSLGR